ncbi:MAG: dehydrogenase [Planctomycetales bacterium 71-10]|nr:MAG: dehydrogenase [Planctomycetales bacterium 71-10]
MNVRIALSAALTLPFLAAPAPAAEEPAPAEKVLKAGLIGLDTSHAVAFTKLLNDPKAPPEVAGVRVVAAFPGGSPDVPSSRDRVPEYTKTLKEEYGVEVVDSIEALLGKVDVVFLESVDGRPHLEQARPVFKARKPMFIDKPVAGSLADAVEIFELAKETGTPVFSSSALRFSPGIAAMRAGKLGDVAGCDAYSPCELEEHVPDFFWYGVHGVETLFTILGTGCESVSRTTTPGSDLAVGVWKGGRIGTFRGIRDGAPHDFGATVFGAKGIGQSGGYVGYQPLVAEIVKFFKSGEAPVSPEETLEIFAFMEAADESKRQDGRPVTIESVLARARAEAASRGK